MVATLSKGKIIPGKGFQYTPKTTVTWAEEFNELLASYNSRNELMSRLIEDGLKVRNGSFKETNMYIPLEDFSHEQLALLKTEEGQRILYNVVSLILGNPESASFAKQMVQPFPSEINSIKPWKTAAMEELIDDETNEKGTEEVNSSRDALSKLMKLGKTTNLSN